MSSGPSIVGSLPCGEIEIAFRSAVGKERIYFIRNVEILCGQTEILMGFIDEFCAAFTVCFGSAGDFRNAFADDRFGDDDFRAAIVICFGIGECFRDGGKIMTVDGDSVPLLRAEIGFCVLALSDFCHRIESNVVRIINHHQIVQTVVSGKGDCFFSDTFLQATVAKQSEYVMVKNRVFGRIEASGGAFARERVSYGIGDALTEWAGGGFHARCFMKFWVAWSDRVELTEIFHFLHRYGVTRHMQP